jgi:probable O-glycosylation ligase (exosortase A-associated)
MYLGGCLAALRMPLVGILVYIVVYHINPGSQWWGQAVESMGLRTSLVLAVAIFGGLILQQPRMGEGARLFSTPTVLATLLFLLCLLSATWGYGYNERSLYLLQKYAKVLIFVFLVVRCVREPEHLHLVILAWIAGVAYIGYQAMGGAGISRSGRLTAGLGGSDFAESSDLSVHLVATLPLIGVMVFMARRNWQRLALLAVGALTVNTLVMTRTRNMAAGLVAMALLCVFSLPRGYRMKGFAALVAGVLLSWQLVDPGWVKRMSTIQAYHEDPSATYRLDYWTAATTMAFDHPLGITIGRFQDVVMEYIPELNQKRGTHNTFMTALAELGFPGLLILLVILYSCMRRTKRTAKAANRDLPPLLIGRRAWSNTFHFGWHALGLRCALVGYVAASCFASRFWALDFWLLIGLCCCLTNVERHVRATRCAADPAPLADLPQPDITLGASLSKGPA